MMCRLARTGDTSWTFSAVGDEAEGPRDYGRWVPELKAYLEDIVPGIRVGDPRDRTAGMRKGQVVAIASYATGPIGQVAMGLAWDITRGCPIDLDASVICLDRNLDVVEIVYYTHLVSSDGTIRHSGDDTTGDGGGDDETIFVDLARLSHNVVHLAFVVCSYSGQHFVNVDNTSCRLYAPNTTDFAHFRLT